METTQAILDHLRQTLLDAYTQELTRFGNALHPKIRDALIDGFRNGAAASIHHTIAMLDVKVTQ